jgi:hypothetical protein
MVAAVHEKARLGCDRAEPADDEAVSDEVEVVEDVLLEALRPSRVVVVGVVADLDGRPGDEVLQEARTLDACDRVSGCGVGSGVGHGAGLAQVGSTVGKL